MKCSPSVLLSRGGQKRKPFTFRGIKEFFCPGDPPGAKKRNPFTFRGIKEVLLSGGAEKENLLHSEDSTKLLGKPKKEKTFYVQRNQRVFAVWETQN